MALVGVITSWPSCHIMALVSHHAGHLWSCLSDARRELYPSSHCELHEELEHEDLEERGTVGILGSALGLGLGLGSGVLGSGLGVNFILHFGVRISFRVRARVFKLESGLDF